MTSRLVRPLALTMGEPAGIGGELTLKTWLRRERDIPPFVVLDDADRLEALATRLGLTIPVVRVATATDAVAVFQHALPVLHHPLAVPVEPGQPNPANAVVVRDIIAHAVTLAMGQQVCAIVTNPIHKAVMYRGGFSFPGHTEFLADLVGLAGKEVMMLACPSLRVVPVTGHVSLREAIQTLRVETIVATALTTAQALRERFHLATPRLAVAGLNPHAGEDGAMGREDLDIIAPAVALIRASGVLVEGPLPPDTMFHAAARERYDAAVCMYHDQALIPLKTIGFELGVNITLGLPFVRTSPDHGTAFALAGTGTADEGSLVEALRIAATMGSGPHTPA